MVVGGFAQWPISLSYVVAMLFLGLHLWHGAGSWLQSLGLNSRRWQRLIHGLGAAVAVLIVVGNCSIPLAILMRLAADVSGRPLAEKRATGSLAVRTRTPRARRRIMPVAMERRSMNLDLQGSPRPAGREVGQAPLRHEAGQPGQQAQVPHPRRRHRPGRRLRRRVAGRTRLQRRELLLPGHPAPRPLASPPRAASTPPRTTRTTATASTASSTTPSRAATSARARPTSTAWPRSASTSSTSASPRACRSPASTAACSPTAPSAAPRCRAPSTAAARPASSCCSAPTRR